MRCWGNGQGKHLTGAERDEIHRQGPGDLAKGADRPFTTGRTRRKPQGRAVSKGRMCDMVMIADRPPEAADRAVPGVRPPERVPSTR